MVCSMIQLNTVAQCLYDVEIYQYQHIFRCQSKTCINLKICDSIFMQFIQNKEYPSSQYFLICIGKRGQKLYESI